MDKIKREQTRVQLTSGQVALAMGAYHRKYDNELFVNATQPNGSRYANALIDDALALCGHPDYKFGQCNWGGPALAFLQAFA